MFKLAIFKTYTYDPDFSVWWCSLYVVFIFILQIYYFLF